MSENLPERIVCLTEESTELLYLLGEERRIVGISAYTVRPERAKVEKPVVSAFISGSIAKIKALEPDLVIGFSDIQADLARDLIKEGLNVLILNQRSLAEIFQAMQMLGNTVGRGPDTAALITQWRRNLDDCRERVAARLAQRPGSRRPRVFFQEWDEPLITGIRWVSELVEIAGGEDCFAELQNASLAKDRITNVETVAARRPDLIVGSWCGKAVDYEWIRRQQAWLDTPALQLDDRLHEIDSAIILQPGPALFTDGLPALEAIIAGVQTV
ncbi:MAG: cobalamin-binding protein [bacterium]|nr:cobalamin-binding protein [bacterium]